MSIESREALLSVLTQDLVGPQGGDEEVLPAKPTDVYLTGLLYPQSSPTDAVEAAAAEDDAMDVEADDASPGAAVPMGAMRRPSSMGISFSVELCVGHVRVSGSTASYTRRWDDGAGQLVSTDRGPVNERWVRTPIALDAVLPVQEGLRSHAGPNGLQWWLRATRFDGAWQITVALTNTLQPAPGRAESEAATFFQVGFRVAAVDGRLLPRRPSRPAVDDDSRLAEILYRDAKEWSVGHTCAATWEDTSETHVGWVESTWLPRQRVFGVDARGHDEFKGVPQECFLASELAKASVSDLETMLRQTPSAWLRWLTASETSAKALLNAGTLTADQFALVEEQIASARHGAQRMNSAIDLIVSEPVIRESFQRSQQAMHVQRGWKEDQEVRAGKQDEAKPLRWRPFQLGFQLLSLASLAKPTTEDGSPTADRLTMDLLWFPTGGGKTEAYLALIAFVLFHRRLSRGSAPDSGAGVAVLARYTLRLLTVQQFERAARLVLAVEQQRRSPKSAGRLGTVPFSIGLWVGADATPNKVSEAREPEGAEMAKQLGRCPACGSTPLDWDFEPMTPRFSVRCTARNCPVSTFPTLSVWTVDQDVYEQRPSILIGTVDKFAQVVRRPEAGRLFGGDGLPPPEMILQDELHLISGPLGTVTALYESAIDRLCTTPAGVPAKIIGSTATIRRAAEQVSQLFNRKVFQFPPPVLDAGDSCFGVTDFQSPGRVYVGVTSSGRSPKFSLQAVCASLLQGASELPETPEARDAYWTLVAYFNSLRELGGAHVMMHDDVQDSLQSFARLHSSPGQPRVTRELRDEPVELTSRVSSKDIPRRLADLEVRWPAQRADLVLATNMLSVGVDIERLGLMVVNGQPKGMAEYIQATSRVGRQQIPGLIVTVYNAGRPRDRSHFEAFKTWHQLLYREVEATSVTPFAPRARDKALHAVVVALVRHIVKRAVDNPTLTAAEVDAAEPLVKWLVARVREIDEGEADAVDSAARDFLETWASRGALDSWWDDHKYKKSLLISAEAAARIGALQRVRYRGAAKETPNSMREVEPSISVKLRRGGA